MDQLPTYRPIPRDSLAAPQRPLEGFVTFPPGGRGGAGNGGRSAPVLLDFGSFQRFVSQFCVLVATPTLVSPPLSTPTRPPLLLLHHGLVSALWVGCWKWTALGPGPKAAETWTCGSAEAVCREGMQTAVDVHTKQKASKNQTCRTKSYDDGLVSTKRSSSHGSKHTT